MKNFGTLASSVLILSGLIWVIIPDFFKRGFLGELTRKSSITQRILSPGQYNIFMRCLGIILVAIGIYVAFVTYTLK
jgi:uncharacterized protein YjeT (DUF2065 family)